MVMIHIKQDAYQKLHPKNVDQHKHMKEISSHAYVLELLVDMSIGTVFNVDNLTLDGDHCDESF